MKACFTFLISLRKWKGRNREENSSDYSIPYLILQKSSFVSCVFPIYNLTKHEQIATQTLVCLHICFMSYIVIHISPVRLSQKYFICHDYEIPYVIISIIIKFNLVLTTQSLLINVFVCDIKY